MSYEIESVEIYPKIVVYKNLLPNVKEMLNTIKGSQENNGGFMEWSQWSRFGEYVTQWPIVFDKHSLDLNIINDYQTQNDIQKKQKDFYTNLLNALSIANKDYIKKFNIDVNPEELIDEEFNKWTFTVPNVCAYDITPNDSTVAMNYHSDFIREPRRSPGYKFVITSLAYFNDDYDDGGIDFCIGKKLVLYKPEEGDIIVFPSGHPEILTEDGTVYIHGVQGIKSNKKYFSRSYWMKYEKASEEWIENENKYGKDKWQEMQKDIIEQYNIDNPQRSHIENGVRIK